MKNRQKELIAQLSEKELLFHLYATQLLLLAVSLIAGKLIFGTYLQTELFDFMDPAILYVGLPAGGAVVALDLFLMRRLPRSFYDDGGLNERIFRSRSTGQIAVIAAIVAFSEELLFRGIIQEGAGLFVASLIFAIVHYRYLHNWFLFLNIVVLSFIIGAVYSLTGNLAVTIAMHFTVDFFLGLAIRREPGFGKGGGMNE